MKKIIFFALLSFFFSVVACDEKHESRETSDGQKQEISETAPDTLVWSMIEKSDTYGNCEVSDSCAEIKVTYPNVTDGPADQLVTKINKAIASILREYFYPLENNGGEIDERISTFITDYKESLQMYDEYPLPWYYEMNVSIAYNTAKVVTLTAREESFLGGAHGNYFYAYRMMSAETGDPLTVEDIFLPQYRNKLLPLVEKYFREFYSVSPNANLSNEGFWFENEEFHLPQQNALIEQGFLAHYNIYEVAPYIMGDAYIVVPYDELKGILKEEYFPRD